jgi:transposase-like protein
MKTIIPKTLIEAVKYFSDLDVCNAYMEKIKWPDGLIFCPACGCTDVGRIASRRMYQCKTKPCRKQFSAKVDTIFENSPLGLDKWFVAVWSITNAKNGISSCELGRALGVTQKTAWHMLHRIRLAIKSGTFRKMGGTVEADETAIGGLAKFMHASRRKRVIKGRAMSGKAIVVGLLERPRGKNHSRIHTQLVPNTQRKTLHSIIHKNVESGASVYTDAWKPYRQLGPDFQHDFVDHAEAYVKGAVHTNGLENFWALFKRCIKGTYVACEPFHLQAYLDEQAFRFNHRKNTDAQRFCKAIAGVVGKKLTYNQLTGKIAGEEKPRISA